MGKTDGGGCAAVRHGADEVRVNRCLAGQFHADLAARFIDGPPANDRIGAREIDVFENAEARLRRPERAAAVDSLGVDHHHFARFDLAHEFRADDVERAGFRRQNPTVTDLAKNQRPHAKRIAHADQLGARHRHDRERAFDAAQGIFHTFGNIALERPRHQVNDAFAVRRRLKDRAAFDQLAAQAVGIGDVAVMGNRGPAHGELAKERLHVADRGLSF